MADQTTMNGRDEAESPAAKVRQNVAGLTDDLLALGELQCRLAACDLKEIVAKGRWPACVIFGSLLLALGTMPVFLLGLGWGLHWLTGMPIGGALLIVAVATLLIVGLAAWWGVSRSRQAIAVFNRSRCELLHNLDWIKKVFLQKSHRKDRFRC